MWPVNLRVYPPKKLDLRVAPGFPRGPYFLEKSLLLIMGP